MGVICHLSFVICHLSFVLGSWGGWGRNPPVRSNDFSRYPLLVRSNDFSRYPHPIPAKWTESS